jgi:type I restriction enzyme S subunit
MNPTLRFVTSASIDWYPVSIKDLVYPIKSGKSKKDDNGDYALYGATGIIGHTNDVYSEDALILAARVGSVGNVSLRYGNFGVSDNVLVIKPNENSNIGFVFYLLVHKVNWKSLSNGTSQSVVSAKKVEDYKVYVPNLEEQQKIAAFFTALDEKIRLSEQKLNLISKIKKGIAQKLFA